MAGTRLDIMQTVKLQVDGVIHNIALSSTAAAKLIAGDPDMVNAVVSAIKLTKSIYCLLKEKSENVVDSSEPLMETSSDIAEVSSECVTDVQSNSMEQDSSDYLVEQLEYFIPHASEQLDQTTAGDLVDPVTEAQAFSVSEALPLTCSEEAPNADNLLVHSSVDSLLDDDTCSDEEEFKWTESGTTSFLEQYKLMAHRFNNGRERKSHLWQELSLVMEGLGHAVTGPQLDWKWKSLRSRFRKARDGRTPTENFIYYEAMKELFALEEMANALPPVLQQSMMSNDGTNGGIMIWSEEATRHLISQYKLREERFRDGIEKKKLLWNEISEVLKSVGVTCTGEQAEGKWKSLLRAFRKAKTLGLQKKAFPFFTEMSEIEEVVESSELDYTAESQEQAEVQWTDAAVSVLLDQYTRRQQRFSGDEKKKSLWLEITEALNQAGFLCTSEQVVGKWKTLVRAFRKAQSSEQSRLRFGFYEKMHELIGDQAAEVTEQELTEQEMQSLWSDSAVKLFLDECQKRQDLDSFSPSVGLWTEMGDVMALHGHRFTPEQIRRKWRSLNEQFFSCLTQNMPFAYHKQMTNLVSESQLTKWEPSHDESPTNFAAERMWTDIALKIFLTECQSRKHQLSAERKRDLWTEISAALRANGYGFTTDQVENKWKSLYRRYKKAKCSRQTAERFPYFEAMEELAQFYDKTESHVAVDGLWTAEAVWSFLHLLDERQSVYGKISRGLWEDIAVSLRDKGFTFTADQIQHRWKILVKEFRKAAGLKRPEEKLVYFSLIKELIEKGCLDDVITDTGIRCNCGRIRKSYDDHPDGCLICLGCTINNKCPDCSKWPQTKWNRITHHQNKRGSSSSISGKIESVDGVITSDEIDRGPADSEGDCIWPHRATEIFLETCHRQKMKLVEKRKHGLWEEISEELQVNGFDLSTEQVENKWKSLYRKYKKAKMVDKRNKSFPYFDQMMELVEYFEKKADDLAVDDKWSPDAIELLINEYTARRRKYGLDESERLWAQVTAVLQVKGFDFIPDQVQYRWEMLLTLYRKASRSPKPQQYFSFYDLMKDAVANKAEGECEKELVPDHEKDLTVVSDTGQHLADGNFSKWTTEAVQILFDEYDLQKDRFQNECDDLLWPEITEVLESKGYDFTTDELEIKWRELRGNLVETDSTLEAESEKRLTTVVGQAENTSYNRRSSLRLRAKPKRKYPLDVILSDGSNSKHSESGGTRKAASTKQNIAATYTSQGCLRSSGATDLKRFLRNFVQKQIEVEDRSFKRLKTVHENKMKSLHELLSSLDGK